MHNVNKNLSILLRFSCVCFIFKPNHIFKWFHSIFIYLYLSSSIHQLQDPLKFAGSHNLSFVKVLLVGIALSQRTFTVCLILSTIFGYSAARLFLSQGSSKILNKHGLFDELQSSMGFFASLQEIVAFCLNSKTFVTVNNSALTFESSMTVETVDDKIEFAYEPSGILNCSISPRKRSLPALE